MFLAVGTATYPTAYEIIGFLTVEDADSRLCFTTII